MNNNSPASNSVRREYRHVGGRTKTGKLPPIMAVPFLSGEAGLLEQTVTLELDPVAGQMKSDIFAEVTCIYVPIQALDVLLNDTDQNAGITEILRRKLTEGQTLFGTEAEGDLSKRMGINPKSYSGVKKVSAVARLAYNASINYLRKRRYIYADLVTKANTAVTNAIIAETTLDRFNAALDPDEHINGNVKLRLSQTDAPLKGIWQFNNNVLGGGTTAEPASIQAAATTINISNGSNTGLAFRRKAGNPAGEALNIWADLHDVQAEGFSLVDLYNAERADELVRQMRKIANANPQDGEDAVLRWVFGLQTDTGQHPFVLYSNRRSLREFRRNAMDAAGLQDEVTMSYMANVFDYAVPVPKTELGGVVVTLLQVTPDEVLDSQPHPILSDDWGAINHAAEQMNIDPEIVILRDLYADIASAADETDPVFYTGHNEIKRNYMNYGFNRALDPSTVEAKTVMWQYAIPAGVTPDNILYPDNLDQYPFLDANAEVVTYDINSFATISTPMFFGPSPVEKLAIVSDNDLLGEDE